MTAPPAERHGTFGRWKPKKWRPEYTRIVAYSVLGKSNVWIAKNLGFTPEHVSTILNQPEGIELADKLHAKMRENMSINIPAVLGEIAEKAVLRVKEVIFDDELMEKSPFQVVDRAFDVLKGLRHLTGGGNGSVQPGGDTFNIGTAVLVHQQRSTLEEGLVKIAEVRKLHAGSEP